MTLWRDMGSLLSGKLCSFFFPNTKGESCRLMKGINHYLLQMLGPLITKASFSVILSLFPNMKALKSIYTSSSGYEGYLLLPLGCWFGSIMLFIRLPQ